MSLDDVRIAEALESIATELRTTSNRMIGITDFLEDYAKENFDKPQRIVIPAELGWIINWDKGYGPASDRIIAWDLSDEVPIPITSDGAERPGEHGRIVHLLDQDNWS